MNDYKLEKWGDILEQKYWDKFVKKDFLSYELFWQKYVVPLTNRPRSVHIKTEEELKKIGKKGHDVYMAQLHYTILIHLVRAYDIIHSSQNLNRDKLIEGMVRLCAATDVADEFLERFTNPKKYKAWCVKNGYKARKSWRDKNQNNNLEEIRYFRNYLLHCPSLPNINPDKFPKIGKEDKYYDWRTITSRIIVSKETLKDFTNPLDILKDAWDIVLTYLENSWQTVICSNLPKIDFEDIIDKDSVPISGTKYYSTISEIKGASDVFTEEEVNPEITIEHNIKEKDKDKKNKLYGPKSKSRDIKKI